MPSPNASVSNTQFGWRLESKVITVDNGARLPRRDDFHRLMEFEAFEVIIFDTASTLHEEDQLNQTGRVQVFPHATLGNGSPNTLFACLDPKVSGTLAPLEAIGLPFSLQKKTTKLTELEINNIALDSIAGVESFDWVSLDCYNDIEKIISHGKEKLSRALLCDIQIPFTFTHKGQVGWARINELMNNLGLRFHCFSEVQKETYMVSDKALEKSQSTLTTTCNALFIPDDARLKSLLPAEKEKLAFLMDTAFDIHDLTYHVLKEESPERADNYLLSRGYISPYNEEESTFLFTSDNTPPPWDSGFSKELSMLHKGEK
ncbi:hypothetical protein [Chromohalobacter israelensis]|uniref:hypothetical protein n=1 Tax=Chromohalobacter israelensis TaxID=141390 RepID=UPI000FFE6BB2|nr:hypothetical protein [Chromohalobacter salexigens]RXE46003.1 hypothetical protein B4O83_17020 [Chromohalobacter salexigens]